MYRETAHYVIETGRPTVSTLVNMVMMQLEMAGQASAPGGPGHRKSEGRISCRRNDKRDTLRFLHWAIANFGEWTLKETQHGMGY